MIARREPRFIVVMSCCYFPVVTPDTAAFQVYEQTRDGFYQPITWAKNDPVTWAEAYERLEGFAHFEDD